LQCDAVWQTERYVILEPRTCHIAGCWHLANSLSCDPKATCNIAGCCNLVKPSGDTACYFWGTGTCPVSCHPTATCHIAGWKYVIPEPHATVHGADTWRIQLHVTPDAHVTLQGAATWHIQSDVIPHPRATLQGAYTSSHNQLPHCMWCHQANYVSWSQSHV